MMGVVFLSSLMPPSSVVVVISLCLMVAIFMIFFVYLFMNESEKQIVKKFLSKLK
jgi:hypothetical protein